MSDLDKNDDGILKGIENKDYGVESRSSRVVRQSDQPVWRGLLLAVSIPLIIILVVGLVFIVSHSL